MRYFNETEKGKSIPAEIKKRIPSLLVNKQKVSNMAVFHFPNKYISRRYFYVW